MGPGNEAIDPYFGGGGVDSETIREALFGKAISYSFAVCPDNIVQLGRININGLSQLQQVGQSSPTSSTRTRPSLLDLNYEHTGGELHRIAQP